MKIRSHQVELTLVYGDGRGLALEHPLNEVLADSDLNLGNNPMGDNELGYDYTIVGYILKPQALAMMTGGVVYERP